MGSMVTKAGEENRASIEEFLKVDLGGKRNLDEEDLKEAEKKFNVKGVIALDIYSIHAEMIGRSESGEGSSKKSWSLYTPPNLSGEESMKVFYQQPIQAAMSFQAANPTTYHRKYNSCQIPPITNEKELQDCLNPSFTIMPNGLWKDAHTKKIIIGVTRKHGNGDDGHGYLSKQEVETAKALRKRTQEIVAGVENAKRPKKDREEELRALYTATISPFGLSYADDMRRWYGEKWTECFFEPGFLQPAGTSGSDKTEQSVPPNGDENLPKLQATETNKKSDSGGLPTEPAAKDNDATVGNNAELREDEGHEDEDDLARYGTPPEHFDNEWTEGHEKEDADSSFDDYVTPPEHSPVRESDEAPEH